MYTADKVVFYYVGSLLIGNTGTHGRRILAANKKQGADFSSVPCCFIFSVLPGRSATSTLHITDLPLYPHLCANSSCVMFALDRSSLILNCTVAPPFRWQLLFTSGSIAPCLSCVNICCHENFIVNGMLIFVDIPSDNMV